MTKRMVVLLSVIVLLGVGFVGGWVSHSRVGTTQDCYIPSQENNPYLGGGANPYLPGSGGTNLVCR